MNWKFWQRKKPSLRDQVEAAWIDINEQWRTAAEAKAAADRAKAKAEWDALPDHRKAARIEYRYFQEMARKPVSYAGGLGSLAQMAAIQNAAIQQFPPSPYMQMNNEIGRVMWLEKGGFLR